MLEIIDHPANPQAPGAGNIRELRLARPPVNALNTEMLKKIIASVEGAAKESAILVTGQPGMFSAGLDVRGILALDRDGMVALFIELWRVQRALAFSPVPVIFGITGHCPAGGTVLAIHADYRVMATGDFRLGLNETQVGLFPGPLIYGAFRRLVGGHAAQLVTRGVLFDPASGLRTGLIDELCDASQVTERALTVARELCELPRESMLRTRAMARADLHALFGNPSHAMLAEREFASTGADAWLVPATQERLRKMFGKK